MKNEILNTQAAAAGQNGVLRATAEKAGLKPLTPAGIILTALNNGACPHCALRQVGFNAESTYYFIRKHLSLKCIKNTAVLQNCAGFKRGF